MRSLARAASALLAALLLASVETSAADSGTQGETSRIVALISGGHPAYERAWEGMRASILSRLPGARLVPVYLARPGGIAAARAALGEPASMAVAIGSPAAKAAREIAPRVPLVYAMIFDPSSIGLPGPGEPPSNMATGVTMDISPEKQFELLRELLPKARRVGVLYNPALSGAAVRRAQAAARAAGLTLVAQSVRTESEVAGAAALLATGVDALWAFPDPVVLTSVNARALILFCLRSRKPLFAVSEGLVRSGALAALAADPLEVGRRAGQIGVRLLAGSASDPLPRPEQPPNVSLFLNRASADHLGVHLPSEALARATTVYPEP